MRYFYRIVCKLKNCYTIFTLNYSLWTVAQKQVLCCQAGNKWTKDWKWAAHTACGHSSPVSFALDPAFNVQTIKQTTAWTAVSSPSANSRYSSKLNGLGPTQASQTGERFRG